MRDYPQQLPPAQQALRDKCVHQSEKVIEFPKEDVEKSIPARFEKIVTASAERAAIQDDSRVVTYAELNSIANAVAHAVLEHDCETEPVTLWFDKGIEQIAAMLGVLKAGRTFVILDPALPPSRIELMLADCQPAITLSERCHKTMADSFNCLGWPVLEFESIMDSYPKENPAVEITPHSLAAIVYTSGATGVPKGVLCSHATLLHNTMLRTHADGYCGRDRIAHLTSGTSNAITITLYALLNGAELVLFDMNREGPERLAHWLCDREITVCIIGTPLFRALCETLTPERQFCNLRLLRLQSEAARRSDVELYRKYFARHTVLVNSLASSEADMLTQYYIDKETVLTQDDVPVGYAVSDKEILLLNDRGELLGCNEIGEIVVRSKYLSPGYWRNPELTAAKFKRDSGNPQKRIYHTGDLGLRLTDGCLIHKGRKDFRVKIRGYGVETGEVEHMLLSHPLVKDAAVVAWDRNPGEKYLVGYIVAQRQAVLTVSDLRMFLSNRLPGYMIPSAFVFLASLPLTNGKLDRRSLPEPDHLRPELKTRYVSPRTELEQRLVELWEEILDVYPIGIDDDFFDLGGYSLLGAKLIEKIKNHFQVELPLRLLAEQPTIDQLAAHIGSIQNAAAKAPTQDQHKYLIKLQSAPGTTLVFCLSHAGNYRGDLLRFAQLNCLIGSPYCFYGIQARGADGLSQPHGTVTEMAAAYIEEIRTINRHGPYFLIGECGAAPIAYETAQQLQARGDRVGLLVLLDAAGSDPETRGYFWSHYIWHRYLPWLCYSMHRRAQSQTLRRIRRSAGIKLPQLCLLQGKQKLGYALLNSPWLVNVIGAELARRFSTGSTRKDRTQAQRFANAMSRYPLYRMARLRYHYRPYAGKIAVIANEEWCNADPTLGWPHVAHGGLEVHKIPGNHDTYITQNVSVVVQVLRECLQRAGTA